MIDSQQASEALADIDAIVRRVRQSRIYQISSLIITMWGVVLFATYITNYAWPRQGYAIWTVANLIGFAISIAIGVITNIRTGIQPFPIRLLITYLLIAAFGIFCSVLLGHFGPRQIVTFWALYVMLFYAIAGLWFGYAFIVIAVCTATLTLIGYYYIGAPFLLWMAVVHGGGLVLGGLWMRRN
jgi:hypothetical protein